MIDKEFVLPLPGILRNWTQTGIHIRNPLESYVSGEKREAFAEVEDYFTFTYSAWIYSNLLLYKMQNNKKVLTCFV